MSELWSGGENQRWSTEGKIIHEVLDILYPRLDLSNIDFSSIQIQRLDKDRVEISVEIGRRHTGTITIRQIRDLEYEIQTRGSVLEQLESPVTSIYLKGLISELLSTMH